MVLLRYYQRSILQISQDISSSFKDSDFVEVYFDFGTGFYFGCYCDLGDNLYCPDETEIFLCRLSDRDMTLSDIYHSIYEAWLNLR